MKYSIITQPNQVATPSMVYSAESQTSFETFCRDRKLVAIGFRIPHRGDLFIGCTVSRRFGFVEYCRSDMVFKEDVAMEARIIVEKIPEEGVWE